MGENQAKPQGARSHPGPRGASGTQDVPDTARFRDEKVNVRTALGGLWISMLFVFAYVDIFGFWRADVIRGALSGEVPGAGFAIDQTFLTLTTIYIVIPSLMITVSLLAPVRATRVANIVVGLLYLVSVVVSIIGETWVYFVIGSIVELVLLAGIVKVAWSWPRRVDAS
jgi:hypothetical protein